MAEPHESQGDESGGVIAHGLMQRHCAAPCVPRMIREEGVKEHGRGGGAKLAHLQVHLRPREQK